MDDVTLAHPLIDAVGPGFVVSETDAGIIELSSARQGLFLEARRAGLVVVLLTPPTSRVTPSLLAMLRRTASAWVVREGAGYRAAGAGVVVEDVASAMLAEQRRSTTATVPSGEVPWTEVTRRKAHRRAIPECASDQIRCRTGVA